MSKTDAQADFRDRKPQPRPLAVSESAPAHAHAHEKTILRYGARNARIHCYGSVQRIERTDTLVRHAPGMTHRGTLICDRGDRSERHELVDSVTTSKIFHLSGKSDQELIDRMQSLAADWLALQGAQA